MSRTDLDRSGGEHPIGSEDPAASTPDVSESVATSPFSASHRRLRSLDAIRGLSIVIMLLAGHPFPREHLWTQLRHPEWQGLSFADLFFPLFLFAVGAAMTLSSRTGSARLVVRRAAILYLVGIGLTSIKHQHLGIFGVLQHIAVAYLVAWLVLQAPRKLQPLLAAGILAVVWLAFVLYAAPGADPWGTQGTFAHAASRAITGGFSTEALVQSATSAVNVLAGAFVARGMKARRTEDLVPWIARHAVWLFVVALVLAYFVPVNKKLWTPSFAVLTIATSCMWLLPFVWVSDVRRRVWSKPLEQLGANPIAIYVVFMTAAVIFGRFRGWWPEFAIFGNETFGATVYGAVWVLLGWLFARWLYRRRIFFKI